MYTIIRYTQCAKTMSDSECSSVTDTDLSSVCSDSTFSGESINKCLYDSEPEYSESEYKAQSIRDSSESLS